MLTKRLFLLDGKPTQESDTSNKLQLCHSEYLLSSRQRTSCQVTLPSHSEFTLFDKCTVFSGSPPALSTEDGFWPVVLMSSLHSPIASMALVMCEPVTAQRLPCWTSSTLALAGTESPWSLHSFGGVPSSLCPVASATGAPSAGNGSLLAGRRALRSEFLRACGNFWSPSVRTWRREVWQNRASAGHFYGQIL